MPKFVTIGYGDQEGYDRTPAAIRNAAHAHDAKLQNDGVLMGIAGKPVQVRNHDAVRVETTNGPFMKSPLPIAGFAIIEAADMAEAIDMVSRTPCAVAHGVVEVWPLFTNADGCKP
ncbi:YciI family protein [Achromobacter veterisilvae]|uniref:YciI family protein n=1 Tax=Achromobacter veterisilvae TaxID=2069367 RepID=A0ABZ2RUN7_9BURK